MKPRLILPSCPRETGWHQRSTGEVSGASVTKVRVVDTYGPLIPRKATGPRATGRGEAVAGEVLAGKWLFALLDGGDNALGNAVGWTDAACGLGDAPGGQHFAARADERDRQPLDTPVPLKGWPMLVTFADIADAASVRLVDPADLAASFGPGVRLKAMALKTPRAKGAEAVADTLLTSLGPWKGDALASAPFYLRVTMGDFIRRAL